MNRVVGNHTGIHLSWKLTSGGTIRKVDMFAIFFIVRCDSRGSKYWRDTRQLTP
jgi:hypothetical protein